MAKSAKNTTIARQVELVIRRLESVSTLPQVAAGFLSQFANNQIDIEPLKEIIEADPALTAKILSLAVSEGVTFTDNQPSINEAISNLSKSTIRNAVLSIKVFQAFDNSYDPDSKRALPRKQLALHALATACCAREISEIINPDGDSQLAFSAGLLHDIGKLAIDEVMPKGFERVVQDAHKQNASICSIEQKHLGLDHTLIGKRLAERWNLGEEIILAIWLHHSDTELICENMPTARIAGIVRLADIIARQCQIGMSGSFDTPEAASEIGRVIGISADQIERIKAGLSEQVSKKAEFLDLDMPAAAAVYCDMVQSTAAKLASSNTKLTRQNRQFATHAAHTKFIDDFLVSTTANMTAADISIILAGQWQKHYQTGPVCVYLKGKPGESFLQAAAVDDNCSASAILINPPDKDQVIDKRIQTEFAVLDAGECAEWVFDQLDVDFNISAAKVIPLIAAGATIGVIIFEPRGPIDVSSKASLLAASTSVAAAIINLVSGSQQQSQLAERFASLLGQLSETRDELTKSRSLSGIAEMAAGAGHELNNPLAVISGRAQLLFESETDEQKKQILKQIQDRTEEISDIIRDLMAFARPKQPTRKRISIWQLLDAGIRKAADEHGLKQIETELDRIEELGDVFVDAEQISTAIANILSNALESYKGDNGPIKLSGRCKQQSGASVFQIIDQGCGMDKETAQKATQPFFSAKTAGRKRGMGLAHAQRLIQLNGGSLQITSKQDQGTIITIMLTAK